MRIKQVLIDTATALTTGLQVTLATVVFLGRHEWGAVFTNIEAVSGRGAGAGLGRRRGG